MQIEVMYLDTIRERLRCQEVGEGGSRGGGGEKILKLGG